MREKKKKKRTKTQNTNMGSKRRCGSKHTLKLSFQLESDVSSIKILLLYIDIIYV